MVAQDTICLCWLAARLLIKHGVGETFIQDEPITKHGFVVNNTDMNLSISLLLRPCAHVGFGRVEFGPPGVATAHGMFTFLLIEF